MSNSAVGLDLDFRQFGGVPVSQGGNTSWYFGWVDDQRLVNQTLPLIAQAQGFSPVWSRAFTPASAWQDDDKDVFFWTFEEKVVGSVKPSWNQKSVGSCVAFGNGRAANDLLLFQTYSSKSSWPGQDVATEPIYGGSRVEVGGGVLGNSDGSLGSWAAKWLIEWGVLLRKQYMGKYDLTSYSEQRCREYGLRGVPDDLEPEARLYPVKGTAMVTTGEQAWQAVGNYFPIATCSNQGFDTPLREGFCEARGSWAHCMEIRGRFIHPTRGKCFVIQNSWADYLKSRGNPHSLVETRSGKVQLPEGCFATTMSVVDSMMRQRDSFALSDLRGFPSRDLYFW